MINFVEYTLSATISSNKIALVTIENHLPCNISMNLFHYVVAIYNCWMYGRWLCISTLRLGDVALPLRYLMIH